MRCVCACRYNVECLYTRGEPPLSVKASCDLCRVLNFQVNPCQFACVTPTLLRPDPIRPHVNSDVQPSLIVASPGEVDQLKAGLERLEAHLRLHAEASKDPLAPRVVSTTGPPGLPKAKAQPVDLEADNIAAQIAQLWLRDGSESHSSTHPLIGQVGCVPFRLLL